MNLLKWTTAALLAATVALASCSATKARINENKDLFDSYSPEVQAMIKSNRISEGMDTTQVYMALGNADRTESRADQQVWTYLSTVTDNVREEKTAAEYREEMRDYEDALEKGATNVGEPETYRIVRYYRTRVDRTVVFENGVVVGWDEPDDMWLDDWHR